MRILIVEDEFIIALDLQILLNELGYKEAYIAENVSRASELLDAVRPDFAILDINVGRDLVFPFAAKLVSRHVPFVFSTGLSPGMLPAKWRSYLVLPKPLERAALNSAMRDLIATDISEGQANEDEPCGSDLCCVSQLPSPSRYSQLRQPQ